MPNNLKNEDLTKMFSLGKRYGYYKKGFLATEDILKEAAAMYASTDDKQEKNRLLWWWVEGIRDYAKDSGDVIRMTDLLVSTANWMIND